jgi:hypothetical protein
MGGRAGGWWPKGLGFALFALWLEVGYAAGLMLVAGLGLWVAAWQAAVCIGATVPLLRLSLAFLSVPKDLRPRLPKALSLPLETVAGLLQLALPWAGWAGALWVVNWGRLPGATAVEAGAWVALFSYLTGLVVVAIWHTRPGDVVVTSVEARIPGLPASFDGYRILHLSDLHANEFNPPARLQERLALARGRQADLVVFTGDLADRQAGRLAGAAEALGQIGAADGALAVLGNHDHWVGEDRVAAVLTSSRVRVLPNAHIVVRRGPDALYIAGVSDPSYTRSDDLARAFSGIPAEATVVLLSHAPDIVRKPLARRAALVLAGHTHGGQLVLPWIGPIFVPSRVGRRLASGLHQLDGQWVFVNRGLGEVFPPFRLSCPPEIALITLRAAQH